LDIFREDHKIFFIVSRLLLLRMTNFSEKFVEEIKTHFVFNKLFFRKLYRLLDNVVKYCRSGEVTDKNIAHGHCLLDT